MQILHLVDHNGLGGAQTVVKGIVENMSEDSHVVFLRSKENEIDISVPHHVTLSYQKWSFIRVLSYLKKYIQDHNIQIIHCHLLASNIYGLLLKGLFFPDLKLVIHEHGGILRGKWSYVIPLRYGTSLINNVISISQECSKCFQNSIKISPPKITLLYNFVDVDKFESKPKRNTEQFTVGFAGRLVKRKGWTDLVQAVKILHTRKVPVRLLIAGSGNDEKQLESVISQMQDVEFLGYVSDMPEFYAGLDCFVIPSHWEPMGLTELEAQASGVPVIASDVPGLNEVVTDQENALLSPAGNPSSLADTIYRLMNDEQLQRKLSEAGLVNARKYSLPEYIASLQNIYHSVL